MPLLTQFKELPKGTIVPVRKMIGRVKELNAFFSGKLLQIQNKVNFLVEGVQWLIPPILTEEKTVKGWEGWSDSFDRILEHPLFLSFHHDETDVTWVYDIIDDMYKVEADMNKFVLEGRAITDAKWNKSIEELKGIESATQLDIEIDVEIWEVVVGIKVFLGGDSD